MVATIPSIHACMGNIQWEKRTKCLFLGASNFFQKPLDSPPLAFHCAELVYTSHGKEKGHHNWPFPNRGGEMWTLNETWAEPA